MGWDAGAGGITALVTRLQALPYYQELFAFAFGSAVISEARIGQALAQFQRADDQQQQPLDTAYAQVFSPAAANRALNVTLPGFTDAENRGRQLFMTGQEMAAPAVRPAMCRPPSRWRPIRRAMA